MLKGKTALVTGSTSGIGRAIAEAFAAEGCNVIVNGFGEAEEIEALRQSLARTSGAGAVYSSADMTKPAEIRKMMTDAIGEFGAVDILVNNAGVQHVAPIEEFEDERWDSLIAILLSSSFHTIKHALPKMRERSWGRIINVSSVHGLVASPEKAAYVSAKHGIIGLTKVVALETAGSGITCNALCPGWVQTPLVERQIDKLAKESGKSWDEAKVDLLSEKMPSREFVTPAQLGAMAVFLCQPACDQVTGVPVAMDGAWTAQ